MLRVIRAGGAFFASVAMAAMAAGCSPAASNGAASAQSPGGGLLQPASVAATGMTTFTDPTENAFTVSVPQGWTVKGGIQRSSPIAAQAWLTAASPDGATTITVGDPSIPGFTLPSATGGSGGQNPVEPYESGIQFATDYAQRAFGTTCSPLTAAGSQAETALAQAAADQAAKVLAAVGQAPPPGSQYDGGSATFTCQANGVADSVGVIDVTSVLRTPTGGFWGVPMLLAYRTPAASRAQTDQLTRAIKASLQFNAQWQAQMAAAERQQLAAIQQQGQQMLAVGAAQDAQESATLRAQGQADMATQTANYNAFTQQQSAQAASRNAAFGQQMYNTETGQQSEMRYINNQTCVRWADAAHTRCAATAGN
jgi:hypothetical protein